MGSNAVLRLRRSAAQLHALAQVEREIRATDSKGRCRYLRDFAAAYRSYERIIRLRDVYSRAAAADVVLIGDYHALPASQHFLVELIEQLARTTARPLVLGLEAVFTRHQNVLDEWVAGQISEDELRERIRFDLDWGYAWEPYRELLTVARKHAQRVYGLDCTPRTDLRRIGARDRHAADKILELGANHPGAIVLVLFGESHLAPNHLPELLSDAGAARTLTILQNVDTLYWRAAGEPRDRVEAVQVDQNTVCVFNATPLDKYESYRLCIDRWRCLGRSTPDLAPSVYNLIDAFLQFLNIDKYAESHCFQTRYLVDLLPEVCSRPTLEHVVRALQRKGLAEVEIKPVLDRIEKLGACHVASLNEIFAIGFAVEGAAEVAARFVHRACQGVLLKRYQPALAPEDDFYARVLGEALAYFGSRILCPGRPPVREADLYPLYAQPSEEIESKTIYTYREYMEMIDFLVLHRDYESNDRHYRGVPELIRQGMHFTDFKREFVVEWLGQMLGTDLYDAYLNGRVAKRFIRSLFMRSVDRPGAARNAYHATVRRLKKPARRLA